MLSFQDGGFLKHEAKEILAAIILGMKHDCNNVKLAAANALFNSLDFGNVDFHDEVSSS